MIIRWRVDQPWNPAHFIGPSAGIMNRFMAQVHKPVKIALSSRIISDTPLCD